MLYETEQTTLPGLKTPEQEYRELINGNYSFSEALQILDKIDWDFKDFTTQYLKVSFISCEIYPSNSFDIYKTIYKRRGNCA